MNKLQKFYNARVAELGDKDFLSHVGHTLGGRSISADMAALLVEELRAALAPGPDDHVLDLCCGNGLFSRQLAQGAASVTGIDLSPELIRIADTYHGADNIRYFQGDVAGLDTIGALRDRRYSRVVMNASLQHFHPRQFDDLLTQILALTGDAPVLLFSYVPENGRQRYFFNTLKKRLKRLYLRATRRDIFGYWWDRRTFEAAAKRHGLTCRFVPIDPQLSYAAYRMVVKLSAPGV